MSLPSGLNLLIWAQPAVTTDPDIFEENGIPLAPGHPGRYKWPSKIGQSSRQRRRSRVEIDTHSWGIRFRSGFASKAQTIVIVGLTTSPSGEAPAPTGLTAYLQTDVMNDERADEAVATLRSFLREHGQRAEPTTLEEIRNFIRAEPTPLDGIRSFIGTGKVSRTENELPPGPETLRASSTDSTTTSEEHPA